VSAKGKVAEAGAVAFVLVSVVFFAFMMFKVPLVGAYKLSAATFAVFKTAWWIIFAVLSFFHFVNTKDAVDKMPSFIRRDRLRPSKAV